jgi:hypothetical protein
VLFGNLVVVILRSLCAFVPRCETVFPDNEVVLTRRRRGTERGKEKRENRKNQESAIQAPDESKFASQVVNIQ